MVSLRLGLCNFSAIFFSKTNIEHSCNKIECGGKQKCNNYNNKSNNNNDSDGVENENIIETREQFVCCQTNNQSGSRPVSQPVS